MPAFAVVDRIGVQTHLTWGDSPYASRFAEVKSALGELGVRYVRDRIGNVTAQRSFASWRKLPASGCWQ